MSRPDISRFHERNIPTLTLKNINSYVQERIPVGNFLEAVLSNDLKGAVGTADNENLDALPAIVAYVRNHTPADCQGSPERYREWLYPREEQQEPPTSSGS